MFSKLKHHNPARTIVTGFLILFLAACQSTQTGAGSNQGPENNSGSVDVNILFQPAQMREKTPRLSVNYSSGGNVRSEWACWSALRYSNPNACITFQSTGSRFLRNKLNVRDFFDFFQDFKWINPKPVGAEWTVEHPLGDVRIQKFHDGPVKEERRKNCAAFNFETPLNSHFIFGWYCNRKGEKLSDPEIEEIVATVGIRGEYEPENVSYQY